MATVTAQLPPVLAEFPTAWTAPLTLASQNYTVDFTWDNRATNNAGAWRVTWRKSDGTVVFAGKKAVLTPDFFEPLHHLAAVPPGRLQIRRADGGTADPGLFDFPNAVLIEYITEDT